MIEEASDKSAVYKDTIAFWEDEVKRTEERYKAQPNDSNKRKLEESEDNLEKWKEEYKKAKLQGLL